MTRGVPLDLSTLDPRPLDAIPKMGIIIPIMGRLPARRHGLMRPFLSPVQQRLLGLLFGQPDRRYQSAELIRLVASGTGAVHRQLQQLAASGLVTVTGLGNQKFYQANRAAPIFTELGLLEQRESVPGAPDWKVEYRITPLFERFFEFHI